MAPFGPWPGEQTGAKFLVDIYNNGLIAPLVDNVFEYATGNKRFIGQVGAGVLPDSGFFESNTTPGDSRIGTDYFSRFYRLGAHIGGAVYDQYSAYDPTWNGTFRGIDGFQHIVAKVEFSNGSFPQNQPTTGLVVGQVVFWNIFGFEDGTDYYPVIGFNEGAREDIRWDLYDEFDGAANERGRLTGWGTWEGQPLILNNGTTAAFDTRARFGGGLIAGDGVGWFVRDFTADPPRGIARWYSADGNFSFGVSGWEFLASNGPATLLSLLKMDPTNGAVFGVPATFPSGTHFAGVVDGVAGQYTSDLLDLTTVADNIPVNVPQRSGFIFSPTAVRLYFKAGSTATAAGTCSISWGNNATHDNAGQSNIAAAGWNTLQPIMPNSQGLGIGGNVGALADSNAAHFARIKTAFTGVVTATAYLQIMGYWVAV